MARVVGIIPSRYASTRLPGKALEDILGKPMIQRVYEACMESDSLDALYVATDDRRIAEVVEKLGGEVIMTSPNHASGTDRLAEAIQSLEADIVVNIQGDYPFLNPIMIREGVEPLLQDPDLPMATMMRAVSSPTDLHNPDVVKVVSKPMLEIYPQLAKTRITHAWGGTLAITVNRMPCFTSPGQNVLSASGYSGHGVAMATLAGKLLAEATAGQNERFDLMASLPQPRFPGGAALRWPLLVAAMTWYSMRDRLGL